MTISGVGDLVAAGRRMLSDPVVTRVRARTPGEWLDGYEAFAETLGTPTRGPPS